MLLFGGDPVYPSHLMMFGCPHNFQVLLEVGLDGPALDVFRADRARHGDGMYTVEYRLTAGPVMTVLRRVTRAATTKSFPTHCSRHSASGHLPGFR